MRIWFKEFENTHLIKDTVIENHDDVNRTKKVFDAIDEVCRLFDLGSPIWLESSIKDFQKHGKVRFTQDNFVEHIDFDYLEMQVIEED
jgi:hypothetical protein